MKRFNRIAQSVPDFAAKAATDHSPGVCRLLPRSGYREQPRASALGKATNEIALKVATEGVGLVPACQNNRG